MDAFKLSSGLNELVAGAEVYDEYGDTVRRLESVLRPVEPSPLFTESLRLRLMRAARKESSPIQISSSGERTREMLVGVALLSVAGALAYLWHSRNPHDASSAVSLLGRSSEAQNLPSAVA